MRIGIDIIHLVEFKNKLQNGGQSFLNQYFSIEEVENKSAENLAGIFAAKEAIFKTGFLKKMDFQAVQIIKNKHSKPEVFSFNGDKFSSLDVSISHTDSMVIAIALWEN